MMIIGSRSVFHTRSFILPVDDTAQFVVGPHPPFSGLFTVRVSWTPGKDSKGGVNWNFTSEGEETKVDIHFEKLHAPFGGAMTTFSELGKINNRIFGFMANFQTYEDTASFTFQFMIDQ